MSQEHVKAQINQALDLLQLITETLEENLIGAAVDEDVKVRASMKAVNALVALLAAEPEILQTERFLEGGRTGWQTSRR